MLVSLSMSASNHSSDYSVQRHHYVSVLSGVSHTVNSIKTVAALIDRFQTTYSYLQALCGPCEMQNRPDPFPGRRCKGPPEPVFSFIKFNFAYVCSFINCRIDFCVVIWLQFCQYLPRLDSFLQCCIKLRYRDASSVSFDSLCERADDQLFGKITNNTQHLLYCLLPPQWDQHYELRQRVHCYQLPTWSSSLLDSNYFMWMMFKNTECAPFTASIL